MHYEDLTLEVADARLESKDGGRSGRFTVRVLASPAGEMRPEQAVLVEYDDKDLQARLGRLEARELDAAGLKELGRLLAALLLPPGAPAGVTPVRELLQRSLARTDADTGLRLRLRLPAELAGVPWEYLYVDRAGGAGMDGFLALDPRTAIVRHEVLDAPATTPVLEGDLRVLAVFSDADGLPELDLDAEQRFLTEALEGVTGLAVESCRDPSLDSLLARLAGAGVFHFAGHGDFRREMGARPGTYTGTGFLALGAERVDSEQVGLNLRGQGVRLAVLSGCNTGRREGVSVWSGIAPALVKMGIPAVVANQYRIQDRCAIAFGRQFYRALAGGLPIERAVAAGRVGAYNADKGGRDWGVPVLYLRAGDGAIFAGTADPQARASNRAAAEAQVQLRIGEIRAGGVVYGAELERMLEGKLGVEIKVAGEVRGRLVGAKIDELQQASVSARVDVDSVGEGGTVIGYQGGTIGPGAGSSRPRSSPFGFTRSEPPDLESPQVGAASPASASAEVDVGTVSGGQVIGTLHSYHGPVTIVQGPAPPPPAVDEPLVEERVRLDAALPESAVVGEPFDLVIAVMQPDAPVLSVPDLPQTVSAEGSVFRAEGEDVVYYRVEVTSPDFDVTPPHYVIGLRPRTNSRPVIFQLTAKRAGKRRLLVNAYQVKDNALAAQTRLSIEVAVEISPG
jgi:hypothetical protein